MDKHDFLKELRLSLTGEIPEAEIENHIRYYNEYLVDDADRSAKEKIKELGEPRLIARTIIDTYMVNHENAGYKSDYYSRYDNSYETSEKEDNTANYHKVRYYSWDTMKWYQKLLAIVIGIALLAFVIQLIIFGVNIFFRLVLPVLIILFLIKLIGTVLR